MCVYVCAYVCASVLLSTSVDAHICTCLWKAKDSLGHYSSGTCHNSFMKATHWPGTW